MIKVLEFNINAKIICFNFLLYLLLAGVHRARCCPGLYYYSWSSLLQSSSPLPAILIILFSCLKCSWNFQNFKPKNCLCHPWETRGFLLKNQPFWSNILNIFEQRVLLYILLSIVGAGKPTKTGLTVLELQNKLPKARVVYASATGI